MASLFRQILFDPVLPAAAIFLIGAALATAAIGTYLRVGSRLSAAQKFTLLFFRLVGIGLLLIVLLQPSRLEQLPPVLTQRVIMVGIDDSRSMAQRDVEQGTRSDAAKALLADAGLIAKDGAVTDPNLWLFRFAAEATPITSTSQLRTDGMTTRVHDSVTAMLGSLRRNTGARALILLTDGHDLELVNPSKTGFNARARQTPLYAIPVGRQGKVKDAALRITSYQPYCYVRQKARISGALRLIGCELETLDIDLLRGDKVVQSKRISAGQESEIAINFEVAEPQVGQYEYEMRVRPLEGEADQENNHAITYLNVIDQQIQVLMLEGAPYWDTSFLQRSLMRNDKMNVDIIAQYAEGKAHLVRKKTEGGPLKLPQTAEEWRHYDVVVLGRSVDRLLGADGTRRLEDYAKNGGGTVIFSRGPAFGEGTSDLDPVIWGPGMTEHVRLQAAREGQALAPFRALADAEATANDALPQLIAARAVAEKKPLAATLASALPADGADAMPGFIHRRFGEGQVLSVGVDGLWRWAFNAKVQGANTIFDRFWDQLILWLMAGRDFLPAQQFSLRASSANIPLGEKIYFRAVLRDAAQAARSVPLVVEKEGAEIVRATFAAADPATPDKVTAEFLPPKAGKYTATATFPDGSKQLARFMVFDDNVEQTEVATDTSYLRRLCESSGGRLLSPEELPRFIAELKSQNADAPAATRLHTLWDRVWCFWMIGLVFGADWFLRRRWGLC